MDRLLEATAHAEHDHFWFHGFRRFVAPVLARAAGGRDLTILDCGCGTGHNLRMLAHYGRAIGIDITYSGVKYAAEQGERKVAQASATNLPFEDQAFDLVTSFDVINSLPDEMEGRAVAEMLRVLRPGGHLLLNVAALQVLRGNHSVLGGEVRRYSRRTLRHALESGGFSILRMTYTNATILPLIAGVRFAQRLLAPRASTAEISVPPRPLNAALNGLLALEAVALESVNMPIGSSVLCLAQRPD